ncbi:hypothetical protein [Methylocystis parvus]|uniref:hypothetical protein n=1 Tax=Methylocystis parvus TaxID=134 RepID=UPI003C75BAC6
MNVSAPFIKRPVATTLLAFAVLLFGVGGYARCPISPLPQVDFPDHPGNDAASRRKSRHNRRS